MPAMKGFIPIPFQPIAGKFPAMFEVIEVVTESPGVPSGGGTGSPFSGVSLTAASSVVDSRAASVPLS